MHIFNKKQKTIIIVTEIGQESRCLTRFNWIHYKNSMEIGIEMFFGQVITTFVMHNGMICVEIGASSEIFQSEPIF